MNKNLFLIINILFSLIPYFKDNNVDYSYILKQYFSFWTKLIRTQGLLHSVKYLKQVRLHVTRYLCRDPLLSNKMHIGLDSSGFPKCISYLKPFIDDRSDRFGQRFALTILCLTRTIRDERKEFSLSSQIDTITKPFNGNKDFTVPTTFIKKFVRHFGLHKETPRFTEKNIFISTKMGPQGPSTMSFIESMMRLDYTQLQLLFNITDTAGQD